MRTINMFQAGLFRQFGKTIEGECAEMIRNL